MPGIGEEDIATETPASAAQASVDDDASNQSPPANAAQDTADAQETKDDTADNVSEKESTVDGVDEPGWKARGFKSERAFLESFDEGRRALSRTQREAAILRKKAASYEDYMDGSLDTEDIKKYVEEQSVQTQYQEEIKELRKERDITSIITFRKNHPDLSQDDVARIYQLSTDKDGTWAQRLNSGYGVFHDILGRAKKAQTSKTQDRMSKKGEIITGTSSPSSNTPNFRTMSSADFENYVAAQRAR